jgi:hypothetical protein
MNLETAYKKVHKVFDEHQSDPHTEVEMRLGKFNGKMFDTNVGNEAFDKIYRALMKYDGWEKILKTEEQVFYRDRDNLRMSVDESTGDRKIVQKVSVHKEDFKRIKGSPFDMRFSVSKEIPTEVDDLSDMDRTRTKHRQSFIRKNLSIDLTMSTGDSVDLDSEDMTEYQVEFEIIQPSQVGDKFQLMNIIQKVNDVFKIFADSK